MSTDLSSQVQWREWGDQAFEEAERADKLILLDIGAAWCHWCHVMDRTTYSDPDVIKLVNDRFIPIKVDADKRPDVQDRYLLGGWPTTAFLIPDGRILTGTTYVPPEAMVHKLKEVDDLYHENKALVTMQVTSMAAEAEAERSEAEVSVGKLNGQTIENLSKILKEAFDPKHGGFGTEPKFPFPEGVRFAFLRHRKTGDPDMLNIALKTLVGMMGLCDPVWGGFYRYSVTPNWSSPHYEKMLYVQAGALDDYLEGYQVTGDDKYGEAVSGVKSYITRFLADNERGGFYASQDADVGSHDPNARLIPGEEYYPKSESDRLAMGVPYVDKTIYTNWNGMMISSYLRLSHVMGDKHACEFAVKTAERLLSENMQNGRMVHYNGGEQNMPGILSDQVYFGQALVDLYQSTGERRYLSEAEKLAGFMESELQDVVDGGFYSQEFYPHAKGELLERHKPFDENVAAAILLTKLNYLTGNQRYRDLAERTLIAIAYPQVTESIVGIAYGLAIDLFTDHPMHIVLVGDRKSKQTQGMLDASLHAYEPGKLVQVLDPSEAAPKIGETVYETKDNETWGYVCVRNVCRPPAKSVEELTMVLEDVLGR